MYLDPAPSGLWINSALPLSGYVKHFQHNCQVEYIELSSMWRIYSNVTLTYPEVRLTVNTVNHKRLEHVWSLSRSCKPFTAFTLPWVAVTQTSCGAFHLKTSVRPPARSVGVFELSHFCRPSVESIKAKRGFISAMNGRKGRLYKQEKKSWAERCLCIFFLCALRAIVLCRSSRPEDKLSSPLTHAPLLCHHSWPSLSQHDKKMKMHCLRKVTWQSNVLFLAFTASAHLFMDCHASEPRAAQENHR